MIKFLTAVILSALACVSLGCSSTNSLQDPTQISFPHYKPTDAFLAEQEQTKLRSAAIQRDKEQKKQAEIYRFRTETNENWMPIFDRFSNKEIPRAKVEQQKANLYRAYAVRFKEWQDNQLRYANYEPPPPILKTYEEQKTKEAQRLAENKAFQIRSKGWAQGVGINIRIAKAAEQAAARRKAASIRLKEWTKVRRVGTSSQNSTTANQ